MARPTKPEASSTRKVTETKAKKRVMFLIPNESEKPIALSALQPEASPAESQSSLPTTLTPSSTKTTVPLHAFSPTPRSGSVLPSAHELFSSPPGVVLDISNPPAPRSLHVHPTHLTQSATNPPVHSLKLLSQRLPWVVSVQPMSPGARFVTVCDVLQALYTNLHKHVKQDEFDTYNKSGQDAISTTFYSRLNKIQNEIMRVEERKKGLRRVDTLMGRTRVKGLRLSPTLIQGDVVWIIEFGT
jgi:hypothetical protein